MHWSKRVLAGVVAVAVSAGTGCSTTHSSAGGFVTDMKISGDRLMVRRCKLDLTYEESSGVVYLVLLPLLIVAAFGGARSGGDGHVESWTLSIPTCRTESNPLPVVGHPVEVAP